MWFALPDELYTLLKKTDNIGGITVMPIPRNASYTKNEGATEVSSEQIKQKILENCVDINS